MDEIKEHPRKKHVWSYKIKAFINHVREINYDLIHVLGTCLSLDEMMIRFVGRSAETHRMKNKPIGEGYKFFTLTTTNWFVANFTPDGRTAAKTGRQECAGNTAGGKIDTMVQFVSSIVDRFRDKQERRLSKLATRTSDAERDADVAMDKFCLAMDNYFTVPAVMKHLRNKGIGVVGTARARRGWPPPALQKVE